jgi:ligand-binding sensor domain-containing protein
LPTDTISSVIIDYNNVKWIATRKGLARFDGNSWTVYQTSNSEIPSNFIQSLTLDLDGSLWMTFYNNGLVHFDGTNWEHFTMSNSGLPSNNLYDLDIDEYGNKWIITSRLVKYDGSNWTVYNQANSPSNITTVCAGKEGRIWVSTYVWDYGRIYEFDGTNFTTVGDCIEPTYYLHEDHEGNLWMSDFTGVKKYDGNQTIMLDVSRYDIPETNILAIDIDSEGTKWLGTTIHGLWKFDGDQCIAVNPFGEGTWFENIWCIEKSVDGSKWIGTGGGGLVHLGANSIEQFTNENSGLPYNSVLSVAVDHNNKAWIATYNGLASYDGSVWNVYNTDNLAIHSNNIYAVEIDHSGQVWIGNNGGEVASFDGSDWVIYDSTNSALSGDAVAAIAIDKSGAKWFGTYGGLVSFDGTDWVRYDTSNSDLTDNSIWRLAIDMQGNKWLGTDNQGLIKFDGTNWTTYNTSNSDIPFDEIISLAIDKDGNKWIGTYDSFGYSYKGGLTVFNENGLPNAVDEGVQSESSIRIYPNPAHDIITIEPTQSQKILRMKLINMQGITVLDKKMESLEHRINVQKIARGMYVIQIQTNKGWVGQKLLIE